MDQMDIDNTVAQEFQELTKDSLEFEKKCAKLLQDVNSRRLTVVQLVEQLGPLLVDKASNNRELGTWILTKVLEGLSPNYLDKKQLEFICTFYADRLKDHHQVIPAVLLGILALAKFEQFPEGAANQLLGALFQNVSCQQQQEQDRHNIYKIFKVLLNKCSTELSAMGLDYVYGVISAVDGERNPKNLVLLFNWFPVFLKAVNLGHLTEEAFEVLACYFPVDFKTPANDSNAVTRDQLANALSFCLTAIPQFAEFCFPMAIEKLESSLEIAKLDALKLLEIGCKSFETSSYIQHSTDLWSHIQKEIFSFPNPVLENACLATLTAVINKISEDSSIKTSVKDIADTVKGNLLPDSQFFDASCKLLQSVATASKISSEIINNEISPILINSVNITTTPKYKAKYLKTLVQFYGCYVKFHTEIEFEDLWKVPILCMNASNDANIELRQTGFEGLSQLCKFLPKEIKLSVYSHLQKILLIPESENVRNSILECFAQMAKTYPLEVKEKLLNNLEIADENILALYLDALCVIVQDTDFTDSVVNIIIHYLNQSVKLGAVANHSLRRIVEKHENNGDILTHLREKKIVSVITDWALSHQNDLDAKSLQDAAFILKTVIGKEESDEQKEILRREFSKIGEIKPTTIFILDGILCRLRRDVPIDYAILNNLTNLILTENDAFIKTTTAQLVANIINKCSDENVLANYLSQLGDNGTDLTLIAWITKALVMRNHAMANTFTDQLLALLKSDKNAAHCFGIIINDNCDSLSLKSHCVKTILYQQKFFTIVSNRLNAMYTPGSDSCLLALGYLLEAAPKRVVLMQFQKILKLIILILESEQTDILVALLLIIKDLIVNKQQCIDDHLSEFLTRLLRLCCYEKSMRVRILALQCLQYSTSSFPIYKLLPHKQEVIQALGKAVDDKKRIVRKEAVETRLLWFLIDAPE